jgi:hypothetical protein
MFARPFARWSPGCWATAANDRLHARPIEEEDIMTKFAIIALVLGAGASVADAQSTVSQWDLQGAPGDQAFTVGAGTAGVTAANLVRGAGLIGAVGANSMNASGWNDLGATDYFSFGFTPDAGVDVDLASLYIGTRSSATGPGFLGLFSSLDGFTTNLFTFAQAPGGNFVNSIVDVSSLPDITGPVEFRVKAINGTAANGGTTGAAGTFRVTGYFIGGVFDRNLQLTGTITPAPGSLALLGLGGVFAARRRRTA